MSVSGTRSKRVLTKSINGGTGLRLAQRHRGARRGTECSKNQPLVIDLFDGYFRIIRGGGNRVNRAGCFTAVSTEINSGEEKVLRIPSVCGTGKQFSSWPSAPAAAERFGMA